MQYRTPGPWGAGKGSNLTAEEFDTNIWTLVQMILAKSTQGVGISNFVVVGAELWVALTDHTLLGPYTLPTVKFSFKGEWAPSTAYYVNDIITHGGSTYMVLVSHTSAGSFDAGANDGAGHDYYGLLLENAPNSLPTGGAVGAVLTKASTTDYSAAWVEPTLSGLFDVLQSPAPVSGDMLRFNGAHWAYIQESSVAGTLALAGLADVEHSPAPTDGQVPTWNVSASKFIWSTPLSGVSLGTPKNGDALVWDAGSSAWINAPLFPRLYWSSPSMTLDLSDANQFISSEGTVQTLTINGASSGAPITWPAPTTFFLNADSQGEPTPTLVADTGNGVVFKAPPGRVARISKLGGVIRAIHVGGDEWHFTGDLAEAASLSSVITDPGFGDIDISFDNFDAEVYPYTPARSFSYTMTSIATYMKGRRLTFIFTTSGTASFTITFGTGFKSTGALATGAVSGKVFSASFICDGTQMVELSRTTAM